MSTSKFISKKLWKLLLARLHESSELVYNKKKSVWYLRFHSKSFGRFRSELLTQPFRCFLYYFSCVNLIIVAFPFASFFVSTFMAYPCVVYLNVDSTFAFHHQHAPKCCAFFANDNIGQVKSDGTREFVCISSFYCLQGINSTSCIVSHRIYSPD